MRTRVWRVALLCVVTILFAGIPPTAAAQAPDTGNSTGLQEVAVMDLDGTENQHLAFDGDRVFATNIDGFRIIDIRPGLAA